MTFPSEPDLTTIEGTLEEFAAIIYEAVHENMTPNWTIDFIAGLDPDHMREMARRWRDYAFDPPDFADRIERLADAVAASDEL